MQARNAENYKSFLQLKAGGAVAKQMATMLDVAVGKGLLQASCQDLVRHTGVATVCRILPGLLQRCFCLPTSAEVVSSLVIAANRCK